MSLIERDPPKGSCNGRGNEWKFNFNCRERSTSSFDRVVRSLESSEDEFVNEIWINTETREFLIEILVVSRVFKYTCRRVITESEL